MGSAGQSCTGDEGALKQPWQGGDGVWIRVAPQREVRLELHGCSDSGKSRRSGRGVGMSFPFFFSCPSLCHSHRNLELEGSPGNANA